MPSLPHILLDHLNMSFSMNIKIMTIQRSSCHSQASNKSPAVCVTHRRAEVVAEAMVKDSFRPANPACHSQNRQGCDTSLESVRGLLAPPES